MTSTEDPNTPGLEASSIPKYRILHLEDSPGYPETCRLKLLRILEEFGYNSEDFEFRYLRDCPTHSETTDVLNWKPHIMLLDFNLRSGSSIKFCNDTSDHECLKFYLTFYSNAVEIFRKNFMAWGVSDILEKDDLSGSLFSMANAFAQMHPIDCDEETKVTCT